MDWLEPEILTAPFTLHVPHITRNCLNEGQFWRAPYGKRQAGEPLKPCAGLMVECRRLSASRRHMVFGHALRA
ncbi:hypothetical protein B5K08_23230 [Rhizobium leguminosarum bv. trifolii]|uniref:Uncharacterized protein n=1 Tax=Rhizobium leguminosarum bv. trifolii TaxID=386 RepID=A0A3E1B7X1_RHILT|nr:hypothetical protein B5K11_28650 [Rhizobium leguminosarum bv. trifolii]RFB86561.1 hypothetical protein B5K11_28680 [Rhizobium leguminosarum bv. trifolii]RFB86996.1 hypothetical protein B5K08_23230 [Rhizobium leguminosarum bv. trifolii]RFB87043.1 hypothetical protein B5K10_23220 [Rhizobium leguminosarum bv. trifolii]